MKFAKRSVWVAPFVAAVMVLIAGSQSMGQEKAADAKKAAAEKAAAAKSSAEKTAADGKKATTEKAAAEKAATEKASIEKTAAEKRTAGKPIADGAAGDADKPKGRLPNHYAGLVDQPQRDKIYKIQASYSEKTDKLQAEIDALNAKRDAEIRAVLTAAQQKQVDALVAEADAKKKSSDEAKFTEIKQLESKQMTDAKKDAAPKK